MFLPLLAALMACGDSDPAAPDAALPDAAVPPSPPDAGAADAGPPPVAPRLRNQLDDMADEDLASSALKLLGARVPGAQENCNGCHGMTEERLYSWSAWTKGSIPECLTDLAIATPETARTMIDCLRRDPTNGSSPFVTAKLGVYASATSLPWFEFLFARAYGPEATTELAAFQDMVLMPKAKSGKRPFTQEEFDVVAEWYERGLPLIDLIGTKPAPACVPSLTPEVATHVTAMARAGWKAVNADNGMAMHGCAAATDVRQCLQMYRRAPETTFGAAWEIAGGTLRVLHTYDYGSSFWTRSSADGRFVAHGGSTKGERSTIVDLRTDRAIPVSAAYDPGFFPDNSAFMFQGTRKGTGICTMGLLTSSPAQVSFDEPQCSTGSDIGLYQHVGAALGGGDYWTVNGDFVSDDGGHKPTLEDPSTYFPADDAVVLTPMIQQGSHFEAGAAIEVPTPFEGDTVLSPSARLLIGRVSGDKGRQSGFRLRKLVATATPTGYTVSVPEIARYCTINGGKPAFSYDERWITLHHYVGAEDAIGLGFTGPSDPGFAPYLERGAANIYLVDLLTGTSTRVTNMQPGQYALFPHFRSDGWIYFVVRDAAAGSEHVVASDAALAMP